MSPYQEYMCQYRKNNYVFLQYVEIIIFYFFYHFLFLLALLLFLPTFNSL